MTDDDKQNAMAMGAAQILKGLLIAKFALRVSAAFYHHSTIAYSICIAELSLTTAVTMQTRCRLMRTHCEWPMD
jgi:ABC-type enterochelin transport system permease subunit